MQRLTGGYERGSVLILLARVSDAFKVMKRNLLTLIGSFECKRAQIMGVYPFFSEFGRSCWIMSSTTSCWLMVTKLRALASRWCKSTRRVGYYNNDKRWESDLPARPRRVGFHGQGITNTMEEFAQGSFAIPREWAVGIPHIIKSLPSLKVTWFIYSP